MRNVLALFVVTLAFALPGLVLADVIPPAPGPDTCTVARKEQEGTVCESCEAEGDGGSYCDSLYEGTDFAYACQTDGGSFWTEVWCDGSPREGCSMAGPGAASLLGLLLAGVGLVALRRRS